MTSNLITNRVLLKNRTATKVIIAAIKTKRFAVAARLAKLRTKFNCCSHLRALPEAKEVELECMKHLVEPKHIKVDINDNGITNEREFTREVLKTNN